MESPFIKYLIPVVKESKVLNRFTNRRFLDCMWDNLTTFSLPMGGLELSVQNEGYKVDQVSFLLGKVDTQIFGSESGFPAPESPNDEYWLSYTPGVFSKFLRLCVDRSTKGYTKQQVSDMLDASKVSQRVKTQARDIAHGIIDAGDVVLSLGLPVNIPFANKVKIHCIPYPKSQNGTIQFDEIFEFSKRMGCSEDLEIISGAHSLGLETYYMSFTVGSKGIKNKVSVELAPEKSKQLVDVLDYLKEKGLVNDSHYPKSPNGFHHVKLTFSKGGITPKFYFSIGYEKRKDPIPKAYQSGRPVDAVKSQN
jgi:hypothetical protein